VLICFLLYSSGRFEAIPDKMTPEEILKQAQNAAFGAADKLALRAPNSKVRYEFAYWLQLQLLVVVCGNPNFGSVSVFKTEPNRILFVKPYFTVTAVLYKTVSDNNSYQTYVASFESFRS